MTDETLKAVIKKTRPTTYQVKLESHFDWANVTIEKLPEGGILKCISSCGNYSYIWGSIGPKSFTEFLAGLDYQYFMNKAHNEHGKEFDSIATYNALVNDVIISRKNGELSNKVARQCYDELQQSLKSLQNALNLDEFYRDLEDSITFEYLLRNDPTNIPTCSKNIGECEYFWEKLWAPLVDYWEQEALESETNSLDLKTLVDNLNTQDNRITADPLFCVEELERIYGMDPNWTSDYVWTNPEDPECHYETDKAFFDALKEEGTLPSEADIAEAEWSDELRTTNEILYTKVYYVTRWMFKTAHLTEAAAEAYADGNSHNLGKTRIYVTSQYRCDEFNAVRQALKNDKLTLIEK